MQFIICETTGDWAAALWRRLPDSVSLIETRSLAEMWDRLSKTPTAVVALELTAERAERLLAALARLDREFPQAMVIVFAQRSLAGWEEIIREAGAVAFSASPRRLNEVVELIRHRATFGVESQLSSSDESITLEGQIIASLPWGG